MIVVFSGPPCSGKSLLGGLVATSRNFTHLEMDAIRLRLLPGASHTREDRRIAYRAMHLMAETLALRGESVIVNAGYSHAADRRLQSSKVRVGRHQWVLGALLALLAPLALTLRGVEPMPVGSKLCQQPRKRKNERKKKEGIKRKEKKIGRKIKEKN